MAVDKVQRGRGAVAGLTVNDIKVVGEQQAHIANTAATANSGNVQDLPAKVNSILVALRAHGLLASS